jgi:hypothetical protein
MKTDELIALRAKLAEQVATIDRALGLLYALSTPKEKAKLNTNMLKDNRGRRKWTRAQKLAASKRHKERWATKKKAA